jgi:AAA+ superfamily predicted ATPase
MTTTPQCVIDSNGNAGAMHPCGSTELLLRRTRLRARRRVLWMSETWNAANFPRDLAIPLAEVDRILEDRQQAGIHEYEFYEQNPQAIELGDQIAEADRDFAAVTEWNRIVQQFALSAFEADLLSLAIAVSLDPSLRRVYAYIHDDATADQATPWLASILYGHPPEMLSRQSPLCCWRLAAPVESPSSPWSTNTPWMADSHIVLWLSIGPCGDPLLAESARFLSAADNQRLQCLYPAQLEKMTGFVHKMLEASRSKEPLQPAAQAAFEIEIVGPPGSGRRTLAAQFAAAFGADLLAIDADRLLGADLSAVNSEDRILRARRMAGLLRAIVCWIGAERLPASIASRLSGDSGVTLFASESIFTRQSQPASARQVIELPLLRREDRLALWSRLITEPAPHVIAEWTLTPGEIVASARVAPAGPEAVIAVCQQNLRGTPAEMFSPLPCPFSWDDIVLLPHLREHLAELEQQVRLRRSVYEEWGFERLCPLGRGITAMFSGASGTGKTMAAQVLARSLDMKLFRVDLAGVMNKYIGETEKRLKLVFDACERSNVLLFFDEADALFGQRTQTKDAHDRFANIEIDYLLQRMEQFDGVAILATNRKGDLDKAFLRRIRFMIDFQQPGPVERLTMWRRALQPHSPAGEELLGQIDMEMLADKLELTGADIASAALGAAFLARAENAKITTQHVLHAARREMAKHGKALRWGDWEN